MIDLLFKLRENLDIETFINIYHKIIIEYIYLLTRNKLNTKAYEQIKRIKIEIDFFAKTGLIKGRAIFPPTGKIMDGKQIHLEYNKIIAKIDNINSDCTRCGGTGYLEQYKHVQNGICFKCS